MQPSLAPAFVVECCSPGISSPSGPSELLSSALRAQLSSSPSNLGELEKFYTLTPADRYFIAGHVATGLLAAGIVVILY
jgi:hypothetical protein